MAAARPIKQKYLAVDTNVLLDLAAGDDDALGAIKSVRQRIPGIIIRVVPTVIQDVAYLSEQADDRRVRSLATTALRSLVSKWKFELVGLIAVGHGITDLLAKEIRARGLLPEAEVNDSLIIAESALADCMLLLSSDAHMINIAAEELATLLIRKDVSHLLVQSPRQVCQKFG